MAVYPAMVTNTKNPEPKFNTFWDVDPSMSNATDAANASIEVARNGSKNTRNRVDVQ